MTSRHSVSQPSCILRRRPRRQVIHKSLARSFPLQPTSTSCFNRNERSAHRSERPVDTFAPSTLLKREEVLCGATIAHPCDPDIAASATERWDTRYRYRHGPREPLTDRAARPGTPGALGAYWTASEERLHGTAGVRGSTPGDARPERHQGRVAQLTHNAALASSGRRAPHSYTRTIGTPSRDEWVGGRGTSQRTAMKHQQRTIPTCAKCKRISVLSPCRNCCSEEELAGLPPSPDLRREMKTVSEREVNQRRTNEAV